MSKTIKSLTGEKAENILAENNKVIIEFGATWCGPCRNIEPILESFAENNQDITIIKIDVDQEPELCAKHHIRNIPALLFFKDGEYKERLIGLVQEKNISDTASKVF